MNLSAITVEEIIFGLSWPNQRIRVWFESFLEEGAHILPVTGELR